MSKKTIEREVIKNLKKKFKLHKELWTPSPLHLFCIKETSKQFEKKIKEIINNKKKEIFNPSYIWDSLEDKERAVAFFDEIKGEIQSLLRNKGGKV